MTDAPLKIAFVGGGMNSAVGNAHRIAAQMDGEFQLVAGCFSRHEDVNRATASAWGVAGDRCYPDWQSLLETEAGALDAIVALTPTPHHGELLSAAIRSGFSIICEKSMATTSAEAGRLLALSDSQDTFLAVTFNYTGYPMVREMRHLIETGELGRITHIQVEMPQEGFARLDAEGNPPRPQAWRRQDGQIPTLSLDLGVHTNHLVEFLTGMKPFEACAMSGSFGLVPDVIDNTMALIRYGDDVMCHMWISKVSLGYSNGLRIRVFGDEGSAEWHQMEPEFIRRSDRYGNSSLLERRAASGGLTLEPRYNRFKAGHPSGFIEAFANHYQDLAQALREHKQRGSFSNPFVFGANEAKTGLCLLEAIQRSTASRSFESV